MDRPPLIVAPYDAELFGHWWYEGPEFLDYSRAQSMLRPENHHAHHPAGIPRPLADPSGRRAGGIHWGEEGYWRVWLNETNAWIYPHLRVARNG
jgi:1,4-alpha-glucan branching enzyme